MVPRNDDLSHYLVCDPFWTILVCSAGRPASWLGRSPLRKLGLVEPTLESILLMVYASRVYHAIRFGHVSVLMHAIQVADHDKICDLAFEVSRGVVEELCK